ncbi:hypothetical protein [Bradyrhizobium elkanii]|uniref:hypothetical protein n=1 Tax=Bradyrhizobium elkanii TaxID=29448 RepID=UPI0004B8C1C1|nr:hypothetical protein [Bradyrhizobium elkanii]WLA84832.1 hypothetical protein QNJ99_11600 [Bradyrhizobium elkanii]
MIGILNAVLADGLRAVEARAEGSLTVIIPPISFSSSAFNASSFSGQQEGVISPLFANIYLQYGSVRPSLMLPAGEIPVPARGRAVPSGIEP